jgi:hypothetical protein
LEAADDLDGVSTGSYADVNMAQVNLRDDVEYLRNVTEHIPVNQIIPLKNS